MAASVWIAPEMVASLGDVIWRSTPLTMPSVMLFA